jgi:uncharacterized membrane protein YdjX (TVP38/TMEM64 family)
VPRVRLALFVLLVLGGAVAVALGAPHSPAELRDLARHAGPFAPVVFVVAWALLTVVLFPGTVLAGAGGMLFGAGVGTPLSILGATLGGVAAFVLARRGARRSLEAVGGERFVALSQRVERRGFVAVLAARAAPGVPAGLLHYAAGASRVRLRDFAAGIALGGAPRVFAYTALGGSLTHPGSPLALAGLGVLALMTVGGFGAGFWRWRRGAARLRAV